MVYGNAAKEFIEDNDETQDLEMPIYYVGLDIVKPHLISCTLGKYIPYYWHLDAALQDRSRAYYATSPA